MGHSRNLHAIIENIFSFQNDDFWIEASSMQATFGDGSSMELDTISVNATTPIGMEILLTSSEIEHPEKRSIRLVLIRPDQDWRQTAAYAWKLDNAWMADQLSPSSPSYSYLHWNVESYVDSSIQVPQYNKVWHCDELEFHFRPIGKGSSSGIYSHAQIQPTLTLTEVKIGALMSKSPDDSKIYIPAECEGREVCNFVDGKVESSSSFHDLMENKDSQMMLGGTISLILVGLLIVFTGQYRRKTGQSEDYEPIQGVEMKDSDGIVDEYSDEEDGSH
ncbi:unnamed protein product [Cylindrotheca closterium]|uniref:Uncharacterized protein n=1 Tax=Cylindrotheca closterium TaxID=2856 RepID=A0AAD2FVX1_9STRA|nr:unnamed protein product [Cylindrotheca closterium]